MRDSCLFPLFSDDLKGIDVEGYVIELQDRGLTILSIYGNNTARRKMTEITFKLTDEIVKQYGELFIRKLFEKQIGYLSLFHTMDRIEEGLKESKLDYDKELEKVREAAWKEYRKDFFN